MKSITPKEGSDLIQDIDLFTVGNLIRIRRESIGMSQLELSEKARIGEKTISRLELGKSSMRIDTFFALAAALSVTPNDISPVRYTSFDPDSRFIEVESRYKLLDERNKQFFYNIIIPLINELQKLN